jgi:hypothetical protein
VAHKKDEFQVLHPPPSLIATNRRYRKTSFHLRFSTYSSLNVDTEQLAARARPFGGARRGLFCGGYRQEPTDYAVAWPEC